MGNTRVAYCLCTYLDISLRLFPKGDCNDRRGKTKISLYLKVGKEKKVEADWTLSIKTAKWSQKNNHIFNKEEGAGNICCTTNELFDANNKFIVDQKLTVKVEGILKVENAASKTEMELIKSKLVTTKNFKDLWNIGFQDVSIVADEKEIKAHKIVLQYHSPVFAEMLNDENLKKITISNVSYGTVDRGIKLLYDPNLVPDFTINEAILLLDFAVKYVVAELKDMLENYLGELLSASNASKILSCAVAAKAIKLQKTCLDYFVERLSKKGVQCNSRN
uniref:BTB domain-containing protein n=1 Tax=Panagrolaimus sp. ES5 TaxID=591445 RepID=A0AC34G807_9BILA